MNQIIVILVLFGVLLFGCIHNQPATLDAPGAGGAAAIVDASGLNDSELDNLGADILDSNSDFGTDITAEELNDTIG